MERCTIYAVHVRFTEGSNLFSRKARRLNYIFWAITGSACGMMTDENVLQWVSFTILLVFRAGPLLILDETKPDRADHSSAISASIWVCTVNVELFLIEIFLAQTKQVNLAELDH
ncbi:hypothetical protein IW262DRAFT_578727 [Armillaria fumosa]|nr:hypothetical protein IW262DRAFT_578727 [Armillaria fumosa]